MGPGVFMQLSLWEPVRSGLWMKIECSAMNGECHGIYRDVWMAWADNQAMWSLIWLQEALRAWCSMQCRWCPRQQQQHSTSAEATGLVSQLDQGDRGAALLPQGQDTGSLCHPPSPGTDKLRIALALPCRRWWQRPWAGILPGEGQRGRRRFLDGYLEKLIHLRQHKLLCQALRKSFIQLSAFSLDSFIIVLIS